MSKLHFKLDEKFNYVKDNNGNNISVIDGKGNVIPRLYKDGRIQPSWEENYNQHEIEQIHELLGTNLQVRFDNNEAIYESLEINATFRKFPGDHNSVTRNHDENQILANEFVKNFIRNIV